MPFPESVVKKAWQRAGGKCQCTRSGCRHTGRCSKELVWENRGAEGRRGAWEAHHRSADGGNTRSNCEILCLACHKNTGTYGR